MAGRSGAVGLEVAGFTDAGGDLDESGHIGRFIELGQFGSLRGESRCRFGRGVGSVFVVGGESESGRDQTADAFLLVDGECRSAVVVEQTAGWQLLAELFQVAPEGGRLHPEAG